LHGFPLTQICRECGELYICEVCGVEGDHKYHDVTNLRPIVVDIMMKFEDNYRTFDHELHKVRESRVAEYRASIYREVNSFFAKVHQAVESMHKVKKGEIDDIFRKLKIDDLSDLDKYGELRQNVERALSDMQTHYRELAFSKIYMNRESIKKIDKAIVDISSHLKQAHATYEAKWR